MLLGFAGGATTVIPSYHLPIYPAWHFTICIYAAVMTYAMFRYQIMDIKIAVTRLGIFVLVYSVILGIPFGVTFWGKDYLLNTFGNDWYWIPLIVTMVFATVGPFVYLYLQRKAEDRLLKEQRAYQAALRQASLGMGQIKNLERLFELIIDVVTRAAKIEHVEIYLYEPVKRQYLLRASSKKDSLVLPEISEVSALFIGLFFTKDSMQANITTFSSLEKRPYIDNLNAFNKEKVNKCLSKNLDPAVYDEIKQRLVDDQRHDLKDMESLMRELNAAVIVPSFIERHLVAFFALGPKLDGKPFSEEDLAAFSILANQAALAIDNINSVEEMKKTQEKLFHSEKLAYVGQLASSVVHEVRNPLTAIKTFVDYLPEKFRLGYLEFLKRFEAIIPREIARIETIVRELLDLAKPRRLRKREVKISEIVARTLESLKDNFLLKRIRLENRCLVKNDEIFVDEEQIQQVLLNLILNALDAMKEGGQLNVKIWRETSATVQGDRMMIAFKDTGCGIPPEQMKILFTPFQTTKKEGVGLGLIITQEIVKLHGGEINVKSEVGRGTEFVVNLPVRN